MPINVYSINIWIFLKNKPCCILSLTFVLWQVTAVDYTLLCSQDENNYMSSEKYYLEQKFGNILGIRCGITTFFPLLPRDLVMKFTCRSIFWPAISCYLKRNYHNSTTWHWHWCQIYSNPKECNTIYFFLSSKIWCDNPNLSWYWLVAINYWQ